MIPAAVVAATLIIIFAVVLGHALRATRRRPAQVELPEDTGQWLAILGNPEPTPAERAAAARHRALTDGFTHRQRLRGGGR